MFLQREIQKEQRALESECSQIYCNITEKLNFDIDLYPNFVQLNFDLDLYPNFVQLLKEKGAKQIEDWLSPEALKPHVNKVELVAAMEKIRTDETFARNIIYQALPPISRGMREAVIEAPHVPRFFRWGPLAEYTQSFVRRTYKDKASDDDIIDVKAKILNFLERLVVLSCSQ